MRFFSPELYVRFNSPDENEADEAYQQWEEAAERYAQHLDTFRDRLPSQVRRLTELVLHDSVILSRGEEIQAGGQHFFHEFPFPFFFPVWNAVAIITVKDGDTIRSLIYCLWDRVRTYPPPEDWPFSKEGEHWLYDELDATNANRGPTQFGGFTHRVLLSTGVVLEIPFVTLIIHEFSLVKIGADVND